MRARNGPVPPWLVLAAVVALLGGGLGAAYGTRADPVPARVAAASQVPVTAASAVCPQPSAPGGGATRVDATSAGALTVAAAAGALVVTDVGTSDPRERARTTVRGAAAGLEVTADVPPLVVRGTGGLAPGLAASQSTVDTAGEQRGLSWAACTAPTTDAWSVGSGAAVGRRGSVHLTNADSAPAVVDLTLWGPDGPVSAPSGRGVLVAPGTQEVVALDALAPGAARLAVRVRTREGRVAVAVRDSEVRGLDPRGVDWVPTAAAPSRRLVVPGVPGGDGSRELQVLAPGDTDALVSLRLSTADGSFAPLAVDRFTVPAGTVATLDLTRALDESPAAVLLEADVPVTASVLTRRGVPGGAAAELAWTAATAPVGDLAVLPPSPAAPGRTDEVLVTAPDGAATVVLTPVAADGTRGTPRTVDVAAGTTVAAAPPGDGEALLLAPRPGGGPVHAAVTRTQTDPAGPLVSVLPLGPATTRVTVPAVIPDLTAGRRAPR